MALTHGRAFRFGVVLSAETSRSEWIDKCRKAEDLGYDTIGVSDHLGKPAPFPAVVLAAEATTRPQLSTYVLNTNFYNPTLLGREVATTNLLTDGRLELGLGTGHIKAHFDAAGLTYPSAAARVDHLESVVAQLQQQPFFFDAGPQVVKRPRLLVGGRGDRVLQLAARYADIIGLSGAASNRPVEGHFPALGSAEMMAERVEYTRHALGDRIREVEFNVVAPVVAPTNELRATLDRLEYLAPSMSVDQRADVPGILAGTPLHIATKLHENRERFGITYTTVLEPSLEAMAPIIERLR
ncbi:TIGR03621 family F420-dependent LLM class oxidoreductase [Nocardia abscessus]|uniref:TIGR03621 family F420-dependent LLM class oxidoreductase n=1 Tax=Nocardia abscessus TaxID=120957 RepID=UPI0024557707|nr:TIGR03621 family F420-dependent LLM class oxidoreductase [Nocardia abscessus]